MSRLHNHPGSHLGWLRAAVLGANDGIVSTASLIVGVASSAARVVNGGEAARFLVTLKFDLERPS